MAEIKVERKKQTPIWPWIIGIILLLGLIWFLVEAFSEDSEIEDEYRENEYQEVEDGQSSVPEVENNPAKLILTDFSKA